MQRLLTTTILSAAIVLSSGVAPAAAAPDPPQIASLGDLKLENGQVLRDCKVAYHTFGQLNADKSNAVLFPTWFSGSSSDLAPLIGPGTLIDSSRYSVIASYALTT